MRDLGSEEEVIWAAGWQWEDWQNMCQLVTRQQITAFLFCCIIALNPQGVLTTLPYPSPPVDNACVITALVGRCPSETWHCRCFTLLRTVSGMSLLVQSLSVWMLSECQPKTKSEHTAFECQLRQIFLDETDWFLKGWFTAVAVTDLRGVCCLRKCVEF